jgi:hypothetical protein
MMEKVDTWEDFKKRYPEVIDAMKAKIERMKNKLAHDKTPHALDWWDGVFFDVFPVYKEKRTREIYIRNFLKENDIKYA